jgi:hypothetical protein
LIASRNLGTSGRVVAPAVFLISSESRNAANYKVRAEAPASEAAESSGTVPG